MISSGRPIIQVAKEIGITVGTLCNRARVSKEEHPEAVSDEPGPVEWARYKALQAENAELKREIVFLGEDSAFFAAKQR